MPPDQWEMLRTIRSASFNDEMACDLLLELSRHAPTSDVAYRVLDIASHMHADARSLEAIYKAICNGNGLLDHTRNGL